MIYRLSLSNLLMIVLKFQKDSEITEKNKFQFLPK